MRRLFAGVEGISRCLHGIAGVSLVFLMFLTVTDVVLRMLRIPFPGTYELVGFAGAVAIGFAMPFTAWIRGNVYVDSFLGRLPKAGRATFHIVTRVLAIGLFILIGWNLVLFGMDLRGSGEVSPTLQLRFYPVAFGLAVASFLQVIVLVCDIAKIFRGEYE